MDPKQDLPNECMQLNPYTEGIFKEEEWIPAPARFDLDEHRTGVRLCITTAWRFPAEGLKPVCDDLIITDNAIVWLDDWEAEFQHGLFPLELFLTSNNSERLRVTLYFTLELCQHLLET
ncbi:hypothetical protein HPB47_015412 [Ixodes persulcatus]|uniref:Uncharacterized protein n=1 Tax=Ixodes persulcatus TaxID=34615 RepID=A0AC60QTK7_IXOPE|nr:hypothetical protein HPB47_015412 [Ixodes persulcatus]